MSSFTKGMRVRIATWQREGAHNQWPNGADQLPTEGVIESVAYSRGDEREVITVAFNPRVRLPVRAEDLQPIEETA